MANETNFREQFGIYCERLGYPVGSVTQVRVLPEHGYIVALVKGSVSPKHFSRAWDHASSGYTEVFLRLDEFEEKTKGVL